MKHTSYIPLSAIVNLFYIVNISRTSFSPIEISIIYTDRLQEKEKENRTE